jgi:hypothetical protein
LRPYIAAAKQEGSNVQGANVKYALPIRVEYSEADKADLKQVLSVRVLSLIGPRALVGDCQ